MADTKFTPGPWEWETPLGDDCYSIVQAGVETHKWQFIAHISVGKPEEGEFPRRQCKANAQLIAAAPELYEALYRLVRDCEIAGLQEQAGFDCWINMANAALAKARGEVT